MDKWLAGILATIISGVTVFYLTEGRPKPSIPLAPDIPEAQAVDVSGSWQGTIFQQHPNGTTVPYSYQLNLSQNGNSLNGNSMLLHSSFGYSVTMKIRGTLTDKIVEYDDVQIISNVAPIGWIWCQKTVRLTYDENNRILNGDWSQNGCGSGQVSLSR